jgi:hypothetical protein
VIIPIDVGRKFTITVNGHKVTGYYNASVAQCCTYKKGTWYYRRAQSIDEARNQIRAFHEPTPIRKVKDNAVQRAQAQESQDIPRVPEKSNGQASIRRLDGHE